MNLENMILSERSSRQSPCVAIPSMRNAQSRQESGRRVGYEGLWGRGRRRATAPAASLLWGQDDVLELVVVAAESVITLGTTESYTFKGEFCGV